MKKVPTFFFVSVLMFIQMSVSAQFSGGSGTEADPYQIQDLNDLRTLSEDTSHWGSHFELVQDIDASDTRSWNAGLGFSPIGDEPNGGYRQRIFFTGSFNGQGHTISGLYIDRPNESYIGLFGAVQAVDIENLTLDGLEINGRDFTGGLVGFGSTCTIGHCQVTGSLSGTGNTGGIAGACETSSIKNSYAHLQVTGANVGGLVGISFATDINNCFVSGGVNGTTIAGGLVGYHESGTIAHCYALAETDANTAGGLLGINYGQVEACYFDTSTTGQGSGIGSDDNGQSVTGLATGDFATATLFENAGWDFDDVWEITTITSIDPDARPYLKMQLYPYHIGADIVPEIHADIIGDSYYDLNQGVALQIIVPSDYTFVGWERNGTLVATANPYSFSCTGNATYTAVLTENVSTPFEGGTGTENDPYQIATLDQLNAIHEVSTLLDRHYILTADIDASDTENWDNGKGFAPIGYWNSETDHGYFTGSFDGNGHTISNLHIDRPDEDGVGLVGHADGARFSKVGLVDCDITGKDRVGGLIGNHTGYDYDGSLSIVQCYSHGTVSGNDYVGGLVGYNLGANIGTCYSIARTVGNGNIGGLLGFSSGANGYIVRIEHCYAAGPVIANGPSGALVSSTANTSIRYSCYDFQTTTLSKGTNSGDVSGATSLGTDSFDVPFYVENLAGFDLVNDWQYAYGRDGHKRPVFQWEKVQRIALDTDGNGTLEGDAVQNVVHGSDAGPFTAYPNEGYLFLEWQDTDGLGFSTENPFSLNDVTEDLQLTALFEEGNGTLAVTFTVTDGVNPIEGATVGLSDNFYVTDANGTVRITKLEAGTYPYTVTATGQNDHEGDITLTNTDVAEAVEMTLVPRVFTSVTFVVKHGTAPVANVDIHHQNIASPYEVTLLTTDANGTATGINLPGASHRYTVTAEGYKTVEGDYTLVYGDRTIGIDLQTIHDVNLTVTDGTDHIPDAVVVFDGMNHTTDLFGRLTISGVVPDRYSYTVTAQGFPSVTRELEVVASDVNETVVLTPSTVPIHTVTLEVTNGNKAITDAPVLFNGMLFYTDGNGEVMVNVPDGNYEFNVFAQNYVVYRDMANVAGTDVTIPVVLTGSSLSILTYIITDGTDPIPNAILNFDGVDYISDSDGKVVTAPIVNGFRYTVTISAQGFADYRFIANPNGNDTRYIPLDPVYAVTFVVDNGTDPVPGAQITVDNVVRTTDAQGMVTFDDMVPGSYDYHIGAQGFADLNGSTTVLDTDITENVSLTVLVDPVYQVVFYVTDGLQAIPDATVEFEGMTYRTATNGEVTVNNVPAGDYGYLVMADGFENGTGQLSVTTADASEYVTLEKIRHILSGRVTDNLGQGLGNVRLNGFTDTFLWTGTDGYYSTMEALGWSGTIAPQLAGYTFAPENVVINGLQEDETEIDFVGTPATTPTYLISGTVLDQNGSPIDGVSLNGLSAFEVTDTNGNYMATETSGWSGTITPELAGYTFAPKNVVISNLHKDETETNFVATPLATPTFVVSGTILDQDGNPLGGVRLNGLTVLVVTDVNGNFGTDEVLGWSGTVIPELAGYTFAPGSFVISDLQQNRTGTNFMATPITVVTFTISGTILDTDGTPLPDVMLDGFSNVVVTDAEGNYITEETSDWSGDIVPRLQGYKFSPETFAVKALSEDTVQDFMGIPDGLEVSEEVRVYPNPSQNGSFTVSLPEESYIRSIRLFTFSGLVHEEAVNMSARTHAVEHRLPSGHYFVEIATDAKVYTERLLVR